MLHLIVGTLEPDCSGLNPSSVIDYMALTLPFNYTESQSFLMGIMIESSVRGFN